jgi:hypothetical protein
MNFLLGPDVRPIELGAPRWIAAALPLQRASRLQVEEIRTDAGCALSTKFGTPAVRGCTTGGESRVPIC